MFMRLFILLFLISSQSLAGESSKIRIGSLAFGTLAWELAVLQTCNQPPSFTVETVSLANPEAGKIALQGGNVDLIVTDWIWSAEQRLRGQDFSFYPYSANHGVLLVPQFSPIHAIADLPGKRLGIAGGDLDKNWLLLRAYAHQVHGLDLDRVTEKVFGAPPLLSQQLTQGRLDAVLNYWNFAAKLEGQGYRHLLDGRGVLEGLGIQAETPALGYVFRESWASRNADTLAAFLDASARARDRICSEDATWNQVATLTHETDAAIQEVLRRRYCAGRLPRWGTDEQQAIREVWSLIRKVSGQEQGGFPTDIFWRPSVRP